MTRKGPIPHFRSDIVGFRLSEVPCPGRNHCGGLVKRLVDSLVNMFKVRRTGVTRK